MTKSRARPSRCARAVPAPPTSTPCLTQGFGARSTRSAPRPKGRNPRRPPMKALRVIPLALLLLTAVQARAEKVLRLAPITDVQLLDPVFGTAWVNVVAGAMIYES